jgi:ion channel
LRIPWLSQTRDGGVLLSLSWEVFIMAISVLSIVNLGLLLLLPTGDLVHVVIITEAWLTAFFVVDIVRRLNLAHDRRAYLVRGDGWLDVLGAVPLLRLLRVLRILLTLRLLRRIGGPDESFRAYFADRAAGGLFLVLFLAILVMEFGSFLMLAAERGAPTANILTAGDAVWYTIVTIATVGYGDQYPVTDLGRILGSVIIIVGVGLFGTLAGYLAQAFVKPSAVRIGVTPAIMAPGAAAQHVPPMPGQEPWSSLGVQPSAWPRPERGPGQPALEAE